MILLFCLDIVIRLTENITQVKMPKMLSSYKQHVNYAIKKGFAQFSTIIYDTGTCTIPFFLTLEDILKLLMYSCVTQFLCSMKS